MSDNQIVVHLDADQADEVRAVASQYNSTVKTTIRRAIALQLFLNDNLGQGDKLVIERANGDVEGVHLLS